MRTIRIGMASINTTVGALKSNTDEVIDIANRNPDCTVFAFQEQVISGYPAEDLVQWKGFVASQFDQLRRFAAHTRSLETVFVLGVSVLHHDCVYNCAAVVCNGKILGLVPKQKLPTYGVFYEGRTFTPGLPGRTAEEMGIPFGDLLFRFPFGTMAVEVCEDIWSPDGPMKSRAKSGAELVVNISASPFRSGILDTRREMVTQRAADNEVTLVYVNQVGANDGLVFDGGGFVNQNGRMLFEAKRWETWASCTDVDLDITSRRRRENTTWRSDALVYSQSSPEMKIVQIPNGPDFNQPSFKYPMAPSAIPTETRRRGKVEEYFDDLTDACVLGLGDYFEKTRGFTCIGVAVSGGQDSTLTAYLAHLYCKRNSVPLHLFSMPSRHNKEKTRRMIDELGKALGIPVVTVPIEEEVPRQLAAASLMSGVPVENFARNVPQNIQARIRGTWMRNWANVVGGLFLQTSNMSEKATGYTTVGGDMQGDESLIANMLKTVVTAMLRYLAARDNVPALAVQADITPSAELMDDQSDEKDLMPFPVLDDCIRLFAGEKMMPTEIYRALASKWSKKELRALDPTYEPGKLHLWVGKFARLFVGSIFKWVQTPISLHLGTIDLERERSLQLPVVQSREWLQLEQLESPPLIAECDNK